MTRPPDSPADAVPQFSADLAASADGASFAAFRQNSAATCEIGLREGASAADFWFRTKMFQLPRAMLFKAASVGHTTRRGPEHIAQGNSQIAIYAFIRGRCETVCDGHTISAGPGDVTIHDFGRPQHSDQAAYEAIILMLPRERMPAEMLTAALHGARLPAGSGAARLLHGMIGTLFETAGALTVAEAEAAIDAVILTTRASLSAQFTRSDGESDRGDDRMMSRALAFIDRNLSDPVLATNRLQDHLGLSRSSLYRLFEPEGGVRAVILRQRLNACLRVLLTVDVTDQPWWKLAADHGFHGQAQFSRAFARRFGVTPRGFHDMVRRRDHDGLTAQAQRAGFITLQAWLDHVVESAEAIDGT